MKLSRAIGMLMVMSACSRAGVTQPSPAGAPAPANGVRYSVNGSVYDTAGRPIAGALLEVLSGPSSGATALTDGDGLYSFGQPFNAVPTLRASKAGYRVENSNVFVLPGTSTIRGWFRMGSPNPPVDLDGTYQFTFSADPSCTTLPATARRRSYQATIADGRTSFHLVTLRGGNFAPAVASSYGAWNVLYITVFENFVRVNFSDPPVWELLMEPSSVYMTGYAEGTFTGAVSEFPMWGEFEFCPSATGDECHDELSCESPKHTLTVTRR